MADESARADKLAAARKKLKQFQVKSSNRTIQPKPAIAETPSNNNDSNDCVPTKQVKMESIAVTSSTASDDSGQLDEHNDKDVSATSVKSSSSTAHHMSMQLNGLGSETRDIIAADVVNDVCQDINLEKRNQELASLLEMQTVTSENLREEVKNLKQRVMASESRVRAAKEEGDGRRLRDLSSMREQAQVHIQTIGILVAEKTELQASLTQSQQTAKQKAGEVEELHGRLKASRQRVTDLETEVATLAVSSQGQEKINKENSKEIDRLKMDIYKVTKTNEELQEHLSEVLEKLNVKSTMNEASLLKIHNLEKELAMANVRVKQLSCNEVTNGVDEHVDELQQKNADLETELGNLKDAMDRLVEEKNEASNSYEKYSLQFNRKVKDLTERIAEVQTENSDLRQSKCDLSEQLSIVKEQLESSLKQAVTETNREVQSEELFKKIDDLEERRAELSRQHQSLVDDNSQLIVLMTEKEHQIEQLEFSLRELRESQSNNGRLLEAIESDKVAASRAMAQNKELKKQLEELEGGFVKMSNDKLALTEKMMEEQHISKELGERLSQQEEEIKELKEQLSDKEHRLSLVHKSSTELTMQMYQQHQIADRIRHFEAQGQLTEMLQHELNQAQQRISALSTQNGELRTILANQTTKQATPADEDPCDADGTHHKEMSRKDDIVKSLSASVRQLELERNQLLYELKQRSDVERSTVEAAADRLPTLENGEVITDAGDAAVVSTQEYHNLKQTLAVLEKRFTRTMQEISDLADQKQELEHKVIQLQGETETIGDYISLYQMQRHVMKQQVAKKDEYIATVCRDREELKEKLTKLQELVCKLLFERKDKDSSMKGLFKVLDKAMLENISDRGQNYVPTVNDMLDCLNHLNPQKKQAAETGAGNNSADDARSSIPGTKDDDDDGGGRKLPQSSEPELSPIRTARKIINLISEIGATNLMEKSVSDNFHPCPVCSGSLQTV